MNYLISANAHKTRREQALTPCRLLLALLLSVWLTACTSTGGGGRYAMDKDAPPDGEIVLDPDNIPDAIPVFEQRTPAGNKTPYTVLGETYEVMPESKGYTETGKVSWYGKKFHGYRTSNGETYDMYKMSAAHKTLPIPSYVRVTNLANGRSGIVRVNDRGPFHSERIMDLSYAAAVKLDVVRTGTAMVKLEAIEPSGTAYAVKQSEQDTLPQKSGKKVTQKKPLAAPVSIPADDPSANDQPQLVPVASGNTYLQAGAFRNQDSAMALRAKLADLTGRPVNVDSLQGFFKVRIGPLEDMNDVQNISDLLVQNNFPRPQVVYF